MAGRTDLPLDDEALVARAQAGDARAFEELVASHLGEVRRFARAFVASEADADDLAQEALVKVYRSLRSFRRQAAFTTWLYAVVRNALVDFTRSRAGQARAREVALGPEHGEGPSAEAAADEQLAAAEERRRLWRALRQVQLEFRTALVLFDVEGHTYDEIAAIEGVAVGTVKSRLSRGRAQLRRHLEAEAAAEVGVEPRPVGAGETGEDRVAGGQPLRGAGTGTSGGRAPSHLPRSGP